MKKILIIGSGGAGKSHLSQEIGKLLDPPVVHLDRLYWKPGWVETPKEEWRAIVAAELAKPRWVMDGNYSGTLDVRSVACDTILFLSFSRWVCLRRIISRYFKYRGRSRPDLADGCPEQLSWDFVKWVWNYPTSNTPKVLKKLYGLKGSTKVFIFRSQQEVDSFLQELR